MYMTISWYSIRISPQSGGDAIFNGYFSVDNDTNLVQGFYDLSLPTSSGYTDVLLPINDPASYSSSTNIYPFDGSGLNFYSTALQTYFNSLETELIPTQFFDNHFNIYNTGSKIVLYKQATLDPDTNELITITGEIHNTLYSITISPLDTSTLFTINFI